MRRQIINFVLLAAVFVSIASPALAQSRTPMRAYLTEATPRLTQGVQPQTPKKQAWVAKNSTLVGAMVGAGVGALVGVAGGKDNMLPTRQYTGFGLGIGAVAGLVAGVWAK